MSAFYFEYILTLASKINTTGAALICFLYPYMIGYQKKLLFKVVEPFHMQEVYEFASLAFAAMPYRFIYLNLNTWPSAVVVFCIKYFYKFLLYFFTLKYKKTIKEKKAAFKNKLRSLLPSFIKNRKK